MLKIFFLVFSLFASQAFAVDILSMPEPIPTNPSKPVLHFSQIKQMYSAGINPQAADLMGKWHLIAFASTAPCAYMAKDAFNEKGLMNNDGSIKMMEFNYFAPSTPPNPGNPPPLGIFGVALSNLGSKGAHQGPFTFNAQDPQFSQWAYANKVLTHSAYLEYSCRIVNGNPNQLVCGEDLQLRSGNFSNESLRCASDRDFSALEIFVKQ